MVRERLAADLEFKLDDPAQALELVSMALQCGDLHTAKGLLEPIEREVEDPRVREATQGLRRQLSVGERCQEHLAVRAPTYSI